MVQGGIVGIIALIKPKRQTNQTIHVSSWRCLSLLKEERERWAEKGGWLSFTFENIFYVLIYTWVYVALPEQRMIKKRGFRHVSGLSAEDTPLA